MGGPPRGNCRAKCRLIRIRIGPPDDAPDAKSRTTPAENGQADDRQHLPGCRPCDQPPGVPPFEARLLHGPAGLAPRAGRVTAALENGSLQRSLALMVASAIALAAWPFLLGHGAGLTTGPRAQLPASPLAWALWALLLVAGAALVVSHRQRFEAVVLTGVIGLVTSLAFVALSAPDL
eukprot:gene2182-3101_t